MKNEKLTLATLLANDMSDFSLLTFVVLLLLLAQEESSKARSFVL